MDKKDLALNTDYHRMRAYAGMAQEIEVKIILNQRIIASMPKSS